TWGSSASAGSSPVNIGGTEIDVYGGYTKTISGITLDGGLYGYIYPGATAGNYYEIYGSVAKAVGPVTAKVGANFAPAQKVFNINWTLTSRKN
ncbi:TorF family putative porin, partial [Streptomyces caniscabiei]|uniref:TorF family putative porin n=1 Tax=Streptomyces caniscabiei TaxID=2746961 RepID=UPI0038F63144